MGRVTDSSSGCEFKVFGAAPADQPQSICSSLLFIPSATRRTQLSSLEVHDLCKVGEAVVVGGVRRSAMISLSNVSDDRMRACKSGAWYDANGQRALANNSAVYDGKPDFTVFERDEGSVRVLLRRAWHLQSWRRSEEDR